MSINRRTALGAVTATGAGALSACGGEEQQPREPGGKDGELRLPTSDVPEGGGVVRERVVVTQPRSGTFEAFDATCPHQGCAVDEVTEKAIVCPCHGSEFDPTDGSVTHGPAEKGLTRMKATVKGDEVVVS
ncbi:Rieske (2Fe-2S) protein [Janibacter corallicola]|uniref:Rieske (2Fe-2S) protein n=1 Tax=Janibacter corallicola TaxID=415212 RepID=UPI00082ABECC|nr:Rieske (2Fe-2S) protein [Janibacter corallicola]